MTTAPAAPAAAVPTAAGLDPAAAVAAPSAFEAIMLNLGLVGLLVVMFYFLLIRPQQKRFKEHSDMLKGLGKGEKVVTQAGFVGVIVDNVNDAEVRVELTQGLVVTMLKSAISGRYSELVKPAAADAKK